MTKPMNQYAGCSDHPRAEVPADLNRGESDAGRARMDEERLTSLESRLHHQIHECGDKRLRNPRSRDGVEARRHRKDLPFGRGNAFGMAATREQRAHSLSRYLDNSRDLETENVRLTRRRGVATRDLRQVGAVDARGGDANQDFPSSGDRRRSFAERGDIATLRLGDV